MTNSDAISTRVVSDLLSDGFTNTQLSTLSFSKLNVENRVMSLLILNQESPDSTTNLAS
ncbi:hypothetical protein ACFOGG_06035 [Brenneria rubrifaciens]